MIGGSGGLLSIIDISKVCVIDVIYGKNKYIWKYGVFEMSFIFDNGVKVIVGLKDFVFIYLGLEWKIKMVFYLGVEWCIKIVFYWFFGWYIK